MKALKPLRVQTQPAVAMRDKLYRKVSALKEDLLALQRLAEVKKDTEAKAIAQETSGAGTALVLRDKEIELRDYYRQTSTARGHWRGQSANAGYSEGARKAGDRAGRNAKIGAHAEIGGASRQLGR